MNKKGQGVIIAMSIGAILLVIILGVIFSTLSNQTSTTPVTKDPFTASKQVCVRVTSATTERVDCIEPGSTTAIENSTNAVDVLSNFTECGSNGDIFGYKGVALINDSIDGAIVNATYTSRSCAFITSGTTRTLVNLLPVLLAIVVLIFILGFVALRK